MLGPILFLKKLWHFCAHYCSIFVLLPLSYATECKFDLKCVQTWQFLTLGNSVFKTIQVNLWKICSCRELILWTCKNIFSKKKAWNGPLYFFYLISSLMNISIHPAVCYLRLDFETFTLNGNGGTTAPARADEGLCLDSFTVTVSGVLVSSSLTDFAVVSSTSIKAGFLLVEKKI